MSASASFSNDSYDASIAKINILSQIHNMVFLSYRFQYFSYLCIVMSQMFNKFRQWLGGLSFRTGVIMAAMCAVCYTVSFAQMLLPISVTAKGVLWTVFFGLAKTLQYTALLILGSAGIARIKMAFRRRKQI